MNDLLCRIRDIFQEDVCNRGLRTDPVRNLITETESDFAAACRSLAGASAVGVVTGFFIPTATPPAAETDGPPGAVFLARALAPLGIRVVLATDAHAYPALEACALPESVSLIELPDAAEAHAMGPAAYCDLFRHAAGPLSHLVAIERVGPNYDGRCLTMRGRDVTDKTSPAQWLFGFGGYKTVGVGDGGNELGMGKLPHGVIAANVNGGAAVACHVPADYLVVAGISNWGAFGLGVGVRLLRGEKCDDLFDVERERDTLVRMVAAGPLVDGVRGGQSVSVDGLDFDRYIAPLVAMRSRVCD